MHPPSQPAGSPLHRTELIILSESEIVFPEFPPSEKKREDTCRICKGERGNGRSFVGRGREKNKMHRRRPPVEKPN